MVTGDLRAEELWTGKQMPATNKRIAARTTHRSMELLFKILLGLTPKLSDGGNQRNHKDRSRTAVRCSDWLGFGT